MRTLPRPLEAVDVRITQWMAGYGVVILPVVLGVVFFWFGAIEFFPGLGLAQTLTVATIDRSPSACCPGASTSCCSRDLGVRHRARPDPR